MKLNTELDKQIAEFISSFELVFEHDWEYTKANLEMLHCFVSDDGTFLNPKIGDEGNNWGNRGSLLSRYRKLVAAMKSAGIYEPNPMAEIEDVPILPPIWN